MKKTILLIVLISMSLCKAYASKIEIVASIPDIGSIASYIGGEKVEVYSIARANSNPHAVDVLPSYMIKTASAKIFLKVGLQLDQWADAIIEGSRNPRLLEVDCSEGINVLDKPAGKVDASMGDVHPFGNPHYWLNPANGIIIAENILKTLKKVDHDNSEFYQSNYDRFRVETLARIENWKAQLAGFKDKSMISYHRSWVYFATEFGMNAIATVEPVPGIPPTAKHLTELIALIKAEKVQILLQESYFPDSAPKFLNRETGIKVVKAAPECSDVSPGSYWKHFDDIISAITR